MLDRLPDQSCERRPYTGTSFLWHQRIVESRVVPTRRPRDRRREALGRSIALDLGAHGHDVAVHYRVSATEADAVVLELERLGASAASFGADLSTEAACRAVVPMSSPALGRLDAVVNNASTFEYDSVATFSYAAMDRHWRANMVRRCWARALHRHLGERGGTGCVVNLLDQKLWNPNPDYLSYTLSKAALGGDRRARAGARTGAAGVRRRARRRAPSGLMSVEAFESAPADAARALVDPADIAAAVRFLLGAAAITGTTLLVDGGQHLVGQPRDVLFLSAGAP